MGDLTAVDKQSLINAIAAREGKAGELAKWYSLSIEELQDFVEDNQEALENARKALLAQEDETPSDVVTPIELDGLWVSQKTERLMRYQVVADILYRDLVGEDGKGGGMGGADLSTAAREFRSYLTVVANELGQLMHRGAGDAGTGDTLSVDIGGTDINNLR